jgi:hypothetical protein
MVIAEKAQQLTHIAQFDCGIKRKSLRVIFNQSE